MNKITTVFNIPEKTISISVSPENLVCHYADIFFTFEDEKKPIDIRGAKFGCEFKDEDIVVDQITFPETPEIRYVETSAEYLEVYRLRFPPIKNKIYALKVWCSLKDMQIEKTIFLNWVGL